MRKVLNTLVAASLLSLCSLPLASFANDSESQPVPSVEKGSEHDHEEIREMHIEIEETYVDYSGVVISPVVVKLGQPADPNIYILPILPTGEEANSDFPAPDFQQAGVSSMNRRIGFDPYRLEPLKVDSLVITKATPADEFMDGARTFGLGLVAAALSLLGIAGVNVYRSRNRKSSNL